MLSAPGAGWAHSIKNRVRCKSLLKFVGRRMATVLPRNRGLKTRGHPSKKRYSVPFRYAPKATHDATSPQQRTLSARIIHYRFISEGSRTLSYEARRSPSATIIPIPSHHRYSSAPQPFLRTTAIQSSPDGIFRQKKQPLLPMFVAGVISSIRMLWHTPLFFSAAGVTC